MYLINDVAIFHISLLPVLHMHTRTAEMHVCNSVHTQTNHTHKLTSALGLRVQRYRGGQLI